jgi:hypothetical protein
VVVGGVVVGAVVEGIVAKGAHPWGVLGELGPLGELLGEAAAGRSFVWGVVVVFVVEGVVGGVYPWGVLEELGSLGE